MIYIIPLKFMLTFTKPEVKSESHKRGSGGRAPIGWCWGLESPKMMALVVCSLLTNVGVYWNACILVHFYFFHFFFLYSNCHLSGFNLFRELYSGKLHVLIIMWFIDLIWSTNNLIYLMNSELVESKQIQTRKSNIGWTPIDTIVLWFSKDFRGL